MSNTLDVNQFLHNLTKRQNQMCNKVQ